MGELWHSTEFIFGMPPMVLIRLPSIPASRVVAAAAVARQVLDKLHPGIEILAWVKSIQELNAEVDPQTVTGDTIESNIVRTGDPAISAANRKWSGPAMILFGFSITYLTLLFAAMAADQLVRSGL